MTLCRRASAEMECLFTAGPLACASGLYRRSCSTSLSRSLTTFCRRIAARFGRRFFARSLARLLLKKNEGVVAHEIRHIERLRASFAAGHAMLLTPNHPRTADPLAMGWLTIETPCHFHSMASWHLFEHGWLSSWVIRASAGSASIARASIGSRSTRRFICWPRASGR